MNKPTQYCNIMASPAATVKQLWPCSTLLLHSSCSRSETALALLYPSPSLLLQQAISQSKMDSLLDPARLLDLTKMHKTGNLMV